MNVRSLNSTDIDLHNAFETFLKYRNVSRMLIFEVVQIFVAKKHEDVGCVKLFDKKRKYRYIAPIHPTTRKIYLLNLHTFLIHMFAPEKKNTY